jgi:signal transduction histidine kinase
MEYIEGVRGREIDDVWLIEVVNVVLKRHERPFLQKRIRVVTETHCDLEVRASRPELIEIIETLVANAEDAMIQGGELTVGVDFEKKSREGIVTVTDTGSGMTSDQINRAFEGFYTSKPQGFGFGLKIATALAERNGAQLSLHAAHPQGVAAVLRMPAKQLEVTQ